MMTLIASTGGSPQVDTDLVAVFQDGSKKPVAPRGAYKAIVERFRKKDAFTARTGSQQFVRFGGKSLAESVLLVGLGTLKELTDEKVRSAGGAAWGKLLAEGVKSVAIQVESFGTDGARLARVFAEGLSLAAYEFKKYKSGTAPKRARVSVIFVTSSAAAKKQLDRGLAEVEAMSECVALARDWSNEPSNTGTPEFYAAQARKIARANGLKCRVLTEADARREKMGLFLSVGQGSAREGRVVILEYVPKGVKKPRTLAYVGKGVTFDSGGVSIKPALRMEDMKHDMSGAANLMAATVLAARLKAPNRIVTVLGFTENMPDGGAIQPGNIMRARNGKTVEMVNTDAEGRLLLGDVLDLAHDFKPDAIVDMATLTGAVSIALGKQAAAILGTDDALIETIRRVGETQGERFWQLPLWDEYFEDMKSDTADIKNSCNDGLGGTIRGAMFLKQFVRPGMAWAHLDIAAMAYSVGHLSYVPKRGATGLYVRTLARLAQEF